MDTKATAAVAARKRLLTARHDGWARRGGAGRGLIGAAGEIAMRHALDATGRFAPLHHSVTTVLGIDLATYGEVDFVCGYYDTSDEEDPVAVTVIIEVKNTRGWHYASDTDDAKPGLHREEGELRRFLRKAAIVQEQRPHALICPVVIVRKANITLVRLGQSAGFLVASTEAQVVLADHAIMEASHHFDEVRNELGYHDLRLLDPPARVTTNYHRGIASKHIPSNARAAAEDWASNYSDWL